MRKGSKTLKPKGDGTGKRKTKEIKNRNYPEDRDSNPGRQSRRVVDLNPLELRWARDRTPLPREAREGLSQSLRVISIIEHDLVDWRSGT